MRIIAVTALAFGLCAFPVMALEAADPAVRAESAPAHAGAPTPKPYLTLYGEPKYKPGFSHFAYVNPNAPKGGKVKLYLSGTFDSLNPFILKGVSLAPIGTYVYETLMTGSLDEPQSYYPLIASDVAIAEDKTSATFTLNPKARWSDGTPVTAEDVVFSLELMKTKSDPSLRLLYQVMSADIQPGGKVRFTFKDPTVRENAFMAASLPILSKAYFSKHDFEKTSLEPPLGSGPYKVGKLEPGRFAEFERNPDYWGRDLPSRRGQYNFDTIRYDVYRDETVAMEAFKAHQYDLKEEYIARNWATAYEFPAVKEGRVKKYDLNHKIPNGMQAFIFNLRKSKFQDRRVRQAIAMTLDFEWLNRALFFSAYERNYSFFQNTPFEARALPDAAETALLEPFRATLPPEVFTTVYDPPKSDGSGNIRERLLAAQRLLDDAGWVIKDGVRVNAKTGEKLEFEFMMSQTTFQRVIMPMIKNLERLGITARFRLVDDAQYVQRLQSKDFDVVSIWWNRGTHFPGNEQRAFWSSAQANVKGSTNLSGLESPVVDMLIGQIEGAKDLASLTAAARDLDRVLLWEHLVIPHWSITHFRTAYWDIFGLPAVHPDYNIGFDSWWMKPGSAGGTRNATAPGR